MATFDPQQDNKGLLKEMVRLARRWEFLWRTLLVVARRSLREVRSLASTVAPLGPLWAHSEPNKKVEMQSKVNRADGERESPKDQLA